MYELDYDNERHGFFFALGNGNDAWSFAPWSSDAQVLYYRVENEKLAQLVVIGGTHVAWQGQPLLQAVKRSEFFEWRRQDAVMSPAPREFSVTALFEELAGGSSFSSANLSHGSSSPESSPYAGKH
jgi:5-deoxy-D-glucuronate isomerase